MYDQGRSSFGEQVQMYGFHLLATDRRDFKSKKARSLAPIFDVTNVLTSRNLSRQGVFRVLLGLSSWDGRGEWWDGSVASLSRVEGSGRFLSVLFSLWPRPEIFWGCTRFFV